MLSNETGRCKAELDAKGIVVDSSSPSFDSVVLSKGICDYMRESGFEAGQSFFVT